MTTKREAEIVEQIVSSMTKNEYWGLVGWLSSGGEGPLWKCLRPRKRQPPLPRFVKSEGEGHADSAR